jgi:DNA-directed RNA polymerase sigma subunit (sigma70/sigma32)
MIEMINKVINTKLCCEEFDIDINKILEIKDESVTSPDELANAISLIDILSNCIIKLTKKQQFVIVKRFGLFGYNIEKSDTIAKQLGYKSRNSVLQIEKQVIRRLGHPAFKLTELINEI